MDEADLASLGIWAWFLAAAVLMILELALPGVFLIWFGLAAAATGVVDTLFVLSWQREVLLFAVLAIIFALIGRNVMRRQAAEPQDKPFLNRRADALVGREFILAEPIENGAGRVRIGDSVWRVVGPDQPAGTKVRVESIDGSVLVVAKAD